MGFLGPLSYELSQEVRKNYVESLQSSIKYFFYSWEFKILLELQVLQGHDFKLLYREY
jgi:hypothetical protein